MRRPDVVSATIVVSSAQSTNRAGSSGVSDAQVAPSSSLTSIPARVVARSRPVPPGAAVSTRGGAGICRVVQFVRSTVVRRAPPSNPVTAVGPAVRAWKSDSPPRERTCQVFPPSAELMSPTGCGRSTPLPGGPRHTSSRRGGQRQSHQVDDRSLLVQTAVGHAEQALVGGQQHLSARITGDCVNVGADRCLRRSGRRAGGRGSSGAGSAGSEGHQGQCGESCTKDVPDPARCWAYGGHQAYFRAIIIPASAW